ncbi:hypothetical protein HOM13_00215 [Candidatus Woesearchaeota archaeon]|jgi:hypothetical protein|nr:hypothetical protein [Candidatus Woesearchaeota archaeon]MBT5215143.1 hypothetical protein [Candidatus Woesearchaeota archaeon]
MNKAHYNTWEKYIDKKFLYRVVSDEYIPSIKKIGLDNNKNPFKDKKKDIFKLFKIVLNLKKRGFIMMRWWGKPVDQEIVINCTKKDLKSNYIDFTPDYKKTIDYYLKLKGGALVNTILIFTDELLVKKPQLKEDEWVLIKKLNKWSKKKNQYTNKIIKIKASSKYLEKAEFQELGKKKYSPSPFGSFENFEKAIKKNKLKYYLPFLKNKKLFYLRVKNKIHSKELSITPKNN